MIIVWDYFIQNKDRHSASAKYCCETGIVCCKDVNEVLFKRMIFV